MGLRYAPYCFTEHGVLMLSSVLNSDRAINVNIKIMRIFTQIRQQLTDNTDLRLAVEKLTRKRGVRSSRSFFDVRPADGNHEQRRERRDTSERQNTVVTAHDITEFALNQIDARQVQRVDAAECAGHLALVRPRYFLAEREVGGKQAERAEAGHENHGHRQRLTEVLVKR